MGHDNEREEIERLAVVVSNSDGGAQAACAQRYGYETVVLKQPSAGRIEQEVPTCILIDWCPSSVEHHASLVLELRRRSSAAKIPIIIFASEDRDVPAPVRAEPFVHVVEIPCTPDVMDRLWRRAIGDKPLSNSSLRNSDPAGLESQPQPAQSVSGEDLLPSPQDHDRASRLVFVIHGRQYLGQFHSFLRALGLNPLEWSDARNRTKKPNPYTWEIVDYALRNSGAIVALFTPDDEARLKPALLQDSDAEFENSLMPQPRQNVLFEAGVAYGRDHQRTVLVRIGKQRPMSDLAGHHILTLDDSASARKAVADALRVAGCPVDTSGSDWLTVGDFRG